MSTVKIKMYAAPDCHYCEEARHYFQSKGVAFEEYDVSESGERWTEMIERSGQLGVPVIFINDKMFIGFDRNEIERSISKDAS